MSGMTRMADWQPDIAQTGARMHDLMRRLYPICRSITGDGVRQTLAILQQLFPLRLHEVPSGTRVVDWIVPPEWRIRDAYVKDPSGRKVLDFQAHNLHVMNYSTPVRGKLSLEELKPHLYTHPGNPDWIPYLTTYYQERWGFCLSQNQADALAPGDYEVLIDSDIIEGSLTYGEFVVQGASDEEVLLSTYLCHPSLCNDNLSGVALLAYLAAEMQHLAPRYTYRFLFIPETIGAITWLAQNESRLSRIKHGLVATCVGDPGPSTYKRSRRGNAEIDQAVEKALLDAQTPHQVLEFFPLGSDERQFCSPGFNLPVGSLMRTPYGRYPEYHTSADNLEFVRAECLADSFAKYRETITILETNGTYWNRFPKGEPQLGRRGLYRQMGGRQFTTLEEQAVFWTLNFSDGSHTLLDIACRSGLPYRSIARAAGLLHEMEILSDQPLPHA